MIISEAISILFFYSFFPRKILKRNSQINVLLSVEILISL